MKTPSKKNPPAPIPNRRAIGPAIWQGTIQRKPWHFPITAVIPCLDHPYETTLAVTLLRLQTLRPYCLLIDTGSTPKNHARLAQLRADDLELHTLARNATQHPCDLITAALDLGFTLADTPYAYTTHQDCFLRSRNFLEYLAAEIPGKAAIGYQLSPRLHPTWNLELGHTATLWDLAEWDRCGLSWSLRRAARLLGHGRPHNPHEATDSIDTEACPNTLIHRLGLKVAFVGSEQNYQRTLDANIDHCRSLICSSLYNPAHNALARRWTTDACRQARARITEWQASGPADPAH